MDIRVLGEADAQPYMEIRLRALRTNPEAFGSTYEQEVIRPLGDFAERIQHSKNQFTLGCFADSNILVGIVNFARESRLKTSHKGNIYGMYVEKEYRGRGLGQSLLDALIQRATRECDGLEQIHLTVVSSNEEAKRLYINLGFEVYGVEPRALKYDGQYFDEDLMVLRV